MPDLTNQRNENLLTPQQQEIVKRIIRAEFDRADQDTAIDVICAAYNMGLPLKFLEQMQDDLFEKYPDVEAEYHVKNLLFSLSIN